MNLRRVLLSKLPKRKIVKSLQSIVESVKKLKGKEVALDIEILVVVQLLYN